MKELKNETGIFRVTKQNNNKTFQGFIWAYQYYAGDYKHKTLTSTKLTDLEQKVKENGMEWKILDQDKYEQSLAQEKETIPLRNKSGIVRVRVIERVNGYTFVYEKNAKDEHIRITTHTLENLEKEVKDRGLEWKVVDQDKYEKLKSLTNEDDMYDLM